MQQGDEGTLLRSGDKPAEESDALPQEVLRRREAASFVRTVRGMQQVERRFEGLKFKQLLIDKYVKILFKISHKLFKLK